MPVTISTHNGSSVAREHNVRNPKVVSKENHINPDGIHETWLDKNPRVVYEELFGKSVLDYNSRQTRSDRKIKDYYKQICEDKKKHPVYEMIVGIYGKNEDGSPVCSQEQGKEILKKFFDNWQDRNPNLILVGAYYHADEDGEPHVHLDYIPVAHGYTRGMETQTALVKALGEQGFTKQGKATAQIQWEKRENDYLTNLCEEKNLTVIHPREEGRKHLQTEIYKVQARLKDLQEENKQSEQRLSNLSWDVEEKENELDWYQEQVEKKQQILTQTDTEVTELQNQKKNLSEEISTLQSESERQRTELQNIQEQALAYQQQPRKTFENKSAYEERVAVGQQAVAIRQRTAELDDRESRIERNEKQLQSERQAFRQQRQQHTSQYKKAMADVQSRQQKLADERKQVLRQAQQMQQQIQQQAQQLAQQMMQEQLQKEAQHLKYLQEEEIAMAFLNQFLPEPIPIAPELPPEKQQKGNSKYGYGDFQD